MTPARAPLLAALAASLALTPACGDDSSGDSGGGSLSASATASAGTSATATATATATASSSDASTSGDSSGDASSSAADTSDASTSSDTSTSGDPSTTSGDPTTGTTGGDADGPPAIFRTPDVAPVCGPTPADACTPGDLAWLASEYGSTYTRADPDAVAAAGVVYRLIAIVERVGPSNLDVFVVDDLGAPVVGVPVAFYYSTAPDPSRPDEWYPVKVSGVTEAEGRVGFALASSAYLPACGAGGPHAVWVSEPGMEPDTTVPSDLADHLGMLGGTEHRHLDLLFQRTPVPGDPVDAVHCPL
ncbi:MAG: hypothetical protein KC420_03550 [Myxococcales bacterium]|nr:hypothetical protein [Myxococcales bacterium]MCB9706881.1 hypothetical protein [Myxococcales bacterium]